MLRAATLAVLLCAVAARRMCYGIVIPIARNTQGVMTTGNWDVILTDDNITDSAESVVGGKATFDIGSGDGVLDHANNDFFQVEIVRHHPAAVISRVRVLGKIRLIKLLRWWVGNPFSIDKSIQPVSGRAAGGSEEAVEAAVERPAKDLARIVDSLDGL